MAHGGREMLSVCPMPADVCTSGILRPSGSAEIHRRPATALREEQLRQQWLRDIIGIDLIAGEQQLMETAIGVGDGGGDHVIHPGLAVFQLVVDTTTGTMRDAQIGQCGRWQGESGQSIWGIAQTELSFDIGAVAGCDSCSSQRIPASLSHASRLLVSVML